MDDNAITFSSLNDFIFCPASIYFHNIYGTQMTMTYQKSPQIKGSDAHNAIDNQCYSSRKNVLQAMACYCEKYNLVGKIDLFDIDTGVLTERKNLIKTIYDGYLFQLYAQYFALTEMGYDVKTIRFYSYSDNKVYVQKLPKDNPEMLSKFENTINEMRPMDLSNFYQTNADKCRNCIYEPACDRSLV